MELTSLNTKPLEDISKGITDQLNLVRADKDAVKSEEAKTLFVVEENYLLHMKNVITALEIIFKEIEKKL